MEDDMEESGGKLNADAEREIKAFLEQQENGGNCQDSPPAMGNNNANINENEDEYDEEMDDEYFTKRASGMSITFHMLSKGIFTFIIVLLTQRTSKIWVNLNSFMP